MLQISALAKSFGPDVLFSGVTLQLNAGCRYGLVGSNGSGKTTLLRILLGDEPPSDGHVSLPKGARIGALRQDRFASDQERIVDVAMRGDEHTWSALREREQLLQQEPVDAARLTQLDELIATHDGYTLEARAGAILLGLGLLAEQLTQPLSTLSGGFKLRVLLGQVLVSNPEVLLLDEPTNHLDIVSIRWLEQFLDGYRGCAIVVSHDRRFLDRVSTHVLDVDYQTVIPYVGNYTRFLEQKELIRAQKEAEIARTEKIIAEKRAFIERFRAKATKARQAQSRVKQVEKIEVEELPRSSRRAPNLRFEKRRHSGKDVLEALGVGKTYGEHSVLSDANLRVRRGERIAVIGANGLGKSTLLRILVGRLKQDAGEVNWGHEVQIGYFAQDHRELLDSPKQTPLDYVWEACPREGTAFVRGQLGRVLFSGPDVEKPVSALSGGEAARVIFCRLMVEQPNVLVFDEPTNHLDIEAIEALVQALLAFEGTLLFVSHDRWFVSQLATRIVEVTRNGLLDYPGTYDEYLAHSGKDHLDADTAVVLAGQERPKKKPEQTSELKRAELSGLSWEERKRRSNQLKSLPQKRDRLLNEIAKLEHRAAEISAKYAEEGFYERATPGDVRQLQTEEKSIGVEIQRLTAEWERVEEELSELVP